MRELIKLIMILDGTARNRKEALWRQESKASTSKKEGKGDSKEEEIPDIPETWSCPSCTASNKMEYVFCMMCTVERPPKWTKV
eukprot:791095-Amorphochlora_amoeboformis.AAC.1